MPYVKLDCPLNERPICPKCELRRLPSRGISKGRLRLCSACHHCSGLIQKKYLKRKHKKEGTYKDKSKYRKPPTP